MENRYKLLLATLLLSSSSCMTLVNQHLETKTNKLTINTKVEKYSTSKKTFYGTINICNLTADTIRFNFNQSLTVENFIAKAEYNFRPVSYACSAFEIKPRACVTWEVIWQTEKQLKHFDKVQLTADTTVLESHCGRYVQIRKQK